MSGAKKVVLLGATGSIGQSTLEVLRRHRDRLELIGVAAHSNVEQLGDIVKEFKVKNAVIFEEKAYSRARGNKDFNDCNLGSGMEGLCDLAGLKEADIVVMAIVGTTGLKPSLEAIKAGKRLALASKEILVMAGEYFMKEVRRNGAEVLPIDSEHSGVFQCLMGGRHEEIDAITLTASGGAFRDYSLDALKDVKVEDALKHPTWKMGQKVTLDCATMANKGLELIEAHWLFGVGVEKLDAVLHPQSIIHSIVTFRDGSMLAQMAPPSMVLPVQYALLYPERLECTAERLDLKKCHELELKPMDLERYPCFGLAKKTLKEGGMACTIFNAANEIAVDGFLAGELSFVQIPQLIDKVLETVSNGQAINLEAIIQKHDETKAKAKELIHGLRHLQHPVL